MCSNRNRDLPTFETSDPIGRAVSLVAVAGAVFALLTVSAAQAVEGVLEINQACAANSGCFAGDAPGLPVTIISGGRTSYRLTSDLFTVAFDVDVIDISRDHVSIDLNGFSIRCTSFPGPCSGSGIGIDGSAATNVTIHNGTVQGMGSHGIRLGPSARVERVRAVGNAGDGIRVGNGSTVSSDTAYQNGAIGIRVGTGSTVQGNTSYDNGEDGIAASLGSTIQGNTATDNGRTGIDVGGDSTIHGNSSSRNAALGISAGSGSTVSSNTASNNGGSGISALSGAMVQSNTARDNGGYGLSMGANTGYRENVLSDNTSGGQVTGGRELGDNLCQGFPCPLLP